jgi:hypothetical protein
MVGLHVAKLVWVIQKMKGWLCVDPSSTILPDDDGAANDCIPKLGTMGWEGKCPLIYYSNALM